MLSSINPATGDVLATFDAYSDGQVDQALQRADTASRAWRDTPVADRAAVLREAAALLEGEKEIFGQIMTLEMGKTFRSAVEEAAKCALACRYYADNAERFLATERVESTGASAGEVRYLPL